MELRIIPLSPDLADAFVTFFDNLEFPYDPSRSNCYCMFYHLKGTRSQWQERSGQQNRRDARNFIRQGKMRGYLAFDGDQCIGWCNANDARSFVRLAREMQPTIQNKRVGCIICFAIHQDYRGRGVARMLLTQAIAGFRGQGYEAVLAIPLDSKDPLALYRGTVKMYRDNNFEVIKSSGDLRVMWLNL